MTTTETHDIPAAALLVMPNRGQGVRLFGDAGTVATVVNVTFNRGAVIVCTDVAGPHVDGRDIPETGAAVVREFAPSWVDHWERGGWVVLAFQPGHVVTADTPAPVNPNGCAECGAAPGEVCAQYNCQGTWY